MKLTAAAFLLGLAGQAAFAAPPDGVCANFYPQGYAPIQGQVTMPWVTSTKPHRGTQFVDANWGTCGVRVTDHAVDGLPVFARNDYSRRQAFNADNSRQLISARDGYWHLYDPVNYTHLGVLPFLAGDAEPQWHPTNPNYLYFLPAYGIGMKLYRLNVATGARLTVGNFTSRLQARWPTAAAAWTKSEGSPSADGRYWCFMVDDANWNGLGIFTWDRDTDTILGMRDVTERPDHVSMSPTGDYCVASHYSASGVRVFPRDLSTYSQINNLGEHSDIGLDANGDDAFVSIDYSDGYVYSTNLRTLVRTNLFPTYLSGTGTALHISAKSFSKPGWFVLSTYAEGTTQPPFQQQWMHRKISVVQIAANPKIYNIADTRSAYANIDLDGDNNSDGYVMEPHASVSRDLSKIVFNSNWDSLSLDIDVYMVQIPPKSIK